MSSCQGRQGADAPRRAISTAALTGGHTLYKRVLSPMFRSAASIFGLETSCRFQPTCADYATLALAQHGLLQGSWLAAWRLLRCNPLARGGWDPVPPAGLVTNRGTSHGRAARHKQVP